MFYENSEGTLRMVPSEYSVGEGDGSVEVCVEIGVPVGGLESELIVDLTTVAGAETSK